MQQGRSSNQIDESLFLRESHTSSWQFCTKTSFKNLLLSDTAKAESIPELEVLSDDVKAAHGAASSAVDSEQIHYLMSRGFSKQHAEALIVEGFLISCFAKINDDEVRQYLEGALNDNYSQQ